MNMATIKQLLSAPVKFPVHPATEEEKKVFSDKPGAKKDGYFYRFELTSGQAFVGYLDTEVREAFFRPVNNLDTLSNLKEVYYFSKYFYSKPELVSRVVLADGCSQEESAAYGEVFDSRFRNLSDFDAVRMENHALGQVTAKMFGPLCEMEYAKTLALSAHKKLKTVLTGQPEIQQKQQERR